MYRCRRLTVCSANSHSSLFIKLDIKTLGRDPCAIDSQDPETNFHFSTYLVSSGVMGENRDDMHARVEEIVGRLHEPDYVFGDVEIRFTAMSTSSS